MTFLVNELDWLLSDGAERIEVGPGQCVVYGVRGGQGLGFVSPLKIAIKGKDLGNKKTTPENSGYTSYN